MTKSKLTWKLNDLFRKKNIDVNSWKKTILKRTFKIQYINAKIIASEAHNVFTKEVNKTALSVNYDKRIHYDGCQETYAYGIGKNIVH